MHTNKHTHTHTHTHTRTHTHTHTQNTHRVRARSLSCLVSCDSFCSFFCMCASLLDFLFLNRELSLVLFSSSFLCLVVCMTQMYCTPLNTQTHRHCVCV